MKLIFYAVILLLIFSPDLQAQSFKKPDFGSFGDYFVNYLTCQWNALVKTTKEAFQKFAYPPAKIIEEEMLALFKTVTVRNRPVSFKNLHQDEMYYRHAIYTGLTYCEPQKIMKMANVTYGQDQFLLTRGFRVLDYENGSEGNWYLFRNRFHRSLVLAYRGTASIRDMLRNLNIKLVAPDSQLFPNVTNGGLVFSGYQNYFKSQQRSIAALLDAIEKYKGHNVVLAGHSLGGAIAYLASVHLMATKKAKVSALYTYGQPITGTFLFDEYAMKTIGARRFARIVSGADLVPFIWLSKRRHWSETTPEIWAPNPVKRVFHRCGTGKLDECASPDSVKCKVRQWNDHYFCAGMRIGSTLCKLLDLDKETQIDSPDDENNGEEIQVNFDHLDLYDYME